MAYPTRSGSRTPLERADDSDREDDRLSAASSDRVHKVTGTFARCIADKMPYGMESMGYEVNQSQQYEEYMERRKKGQKGAVRWLVLCLIGLGTGFVAISVEFSIEQLSELRMTMNDATVSAVEGMRAGVWLQYLSFLGFRVTAAAVAGFLVCYVEVLAAGSGIPEIKCYLNGVCMKKVVGFKTLVAKAVGIVFSVAADLPVGKEGPMIHSGAIIGALTTQLKFPNSERPFRDGVARRDLVAAGASAGVAAAFGAPIGSVLFAIEEGTSHMNPNIMMRCFVACCVAALVSRLFASSVKGNQPFGHLGGSVPVSFGRFEETDYHPIELCFFALLSIFGGLSGSLFNALNKQLSLWRKRHIPTRGTVRFVEVLLVDAFIVTVKFWIPVLAMGGKARANEDLPPTLQLFWATGTQAMKTLFHEEEHLHLGYLAIFALINFEFSCLTYGLGVPSGLFVPSLLTGAAYGRLLGQAVDDCLRQSLRPHPGLYALVGAVANLAGAARITISLAMILMEATGCTGFALPILFTVMVGKWTGDALNCVTDRGIYDMHIVELKHVPLLEQMPERPLLGVQVREVMARNPIMVESVESVKSLIDTLECCRHNGFPVVFPGTFRLAGMLRRSTLHMVLERCVECGILQEPSGPLHKFPAIRFEDFAYSPNKFETFDELRGELGPTYLEHRLDLWPYINRNGYMMPKQASVASCFMLFRRLGLRHLPVVLPNGDVCGIVTRKDLILCEEGHEQLPDVNVEQLPDVSVEQLPSLSTGDQPSLLSGEPPLHSRRMMRRRTTRKSTRKQTRKSSIASFASSFSRHALGDGESDDDDDDGSSGDNSDALISHDNFFGGTGM